ncbi:hypothetical protein GF318_02900 [Candidatus Micrarchaeota archaeon]|nr:hypothetical protein [Candidatus Micrarchaeota archaeon]
MRFGKKAEQGRLKRAGRAVKKWAASPVLAAGLLLGTPRVAAEQAPAPAETQPAGPSISAAVTAGGYDIASTPVLGAEIAMNYQPAETLTIDAKASALTRVENSNGAELDEIELDLTVPISGPFSATAFGYRSQYYAVQYGGGVSLHLELPHGFGLHAAPQITDGPLVPIPVSVTSDVGPVSLMLGIVPVANLPMLERPAPFLGADASVTVHVGSMDLFVRAFEMTLIHDDRSLEIGVFNVQGGLRFNM